MNVSFKKSAIAIACSVLILQAQAIEVVPPSADTFNAAGMLNQYKQSLDSLISTAPLNDGAANYQEFNGFDFEGLTPTQKSRAQSLVAPYVGKKIIIGKLINELERNFQDQGDPFVFVLTETKALPVLTASKVNYGKAEINNASNLNSSLLQGILDFGVKDGAPVDRPQLERNTSVLNEVPGVINQFGMRPGAKQGDTDLVANVNTGPWYNGSVTVDNSGTKSLGVVTGKGDFSLNNLFGFGDIIRLFGLGSSNSNMEGVDVSAIVHPSGLRAGASASRFAYGYNTLAQTTTFDTLGNPAWLNNINTRYTGTSDDIGAYLSYPLTRSEYSRQSITLNYDHVTNVSNAFIAQDSTSAINGSTQSKSANFNLSNTTVDKVALGTFGVTSIPFQIVSSYQASVTGGNAVQNLADVSAIDAASAKQMGTFLKLTGSGLLSRNINIADSDFTLTGSGSLQLANKNLPSSEKAYLGGMTQMQAWAPQVLATDQMAYAQIKFEKQIIPNVSAGVFVEGSYSQQNTNAYQTSFGTIATGNNFMSDAGLSLSYQSSQNISLNASVASKLSGNPKVNGIPIQDNSNVRGWVGATIRF